MTISLFLTLCAALQTPAPAPAPEQAPQAAPGANPAGARGPEDWSSLNRVVIVVNDDIVTYAQLQGRYAFALRSGFDKPRTRAEDVYKRQGVALALNETLCEALALAHDIGHPPFGHRGEVALDELMSDFEGFRHNAQVLRVVDVLERRSPEYPGLNLTRELRESLLKHEGKDVWPEEFAPRPRHPCLEAQVVDLADSTAYDVHDVEDGLFANMFSEDDLYAGSELWRRSCASVEQRHPGFLGTTYDRKLRVKRVATELIGTCINDLITASARRIAEAGVATVDEVRAHPRMLVGHGDELHPAVQELQAFLYARFYRHPHLMELSEHARKVLGALFTVYVERPAEMSAWYTSWADEVGLQRAVCDYLAGMTDRFAELEYARLVR